MSNTLLQELISGKPNLVKRIRKEFPDLFDLTGSPSLTEKKRKSSCINKVKNDLIAAKSAPLLNPPSNFETLPELIEVSRPEAILLSPSPSLLLQTHLEVDFKRYLKTHLKTDFRRYLKTDFRRYLKRYLKRYLVLQRHDFSPRDRLLVLPAEFLDLLSALGKDYFIIKCKSPSSFNICYALYKSCMVAANCCYFSNGFLAHGKGGDNHCQGGALDLFLLPLLDTATSARLKELGGRLYQEDQKAISSKRHISVEDLCNPKPSSLSGKLLQKIDRTIKRLYDFSNFPTGLNINREQWALLKLYAQNTQLLDGLNRL